MGIARRLESDWRLIIPDLRNHGRSPHAASMNYQCMAEDLVSLMDRLGLSMAHMIGHSMGGKLAMTLALQHGERVEKLIVADVAPVNYVHSFDEIFTGLQSVDLNRLSGRQEVSNTFRDCRK